PGETARESVDHSSDLRFVILRVACTGAGLRHPAQRRPRARCTLGMEGNGPSSRRFNACLTGCSAFDPRAHYGRTTAHSDESGSKTQKCEAVQAACSRLRSAYDAYIAALHQLSLAMGVGWFGTKTEELLADGKQDDLRDELRAYDAMQKAGCKACPDL